MYMTVEMALTLLLLSLLVCLFSGLLSFYAAYIILGLGCGCGFSWFYREKQIPAANLIFSACVLGVFIWMITSILHSSFEFQEIIRIFINGVFILEVIFGFNATSSAFLSYMQGLSLPLLMSYAASASKLRLGPVILILGYLFLWLAIMRVKFFRSFSTKPERDLQKNALKAAPLILIFLINLSVSSVLLFSLPLGKIENIGFIQTQEETLDSELSVLETDYYELQKRIQKLVTDMISAEKSSQDLYEILAFLKAIIKDWPHVLEVEKAEEGLISYLRTPGPGLEKADAEGSVYLKGYIDKKVSLLLKKSEDKIIENLRKKPFKIQEKFSILTNAQKLGREKSYQGVTKHGKALRKIVSGSSLGGKAKENIRAEIERFTEWKIFQLYRSKLSELHKVAGSLEAEGKQEFVSLLLEIEEAGQVSEFKNLEARLELLEERAAFKANELIQELKEAVDLRLQMALLEKESRLEEKIEESDLSSSAVQELQETLSVQEALEEEEKFSEASQKLEGIPEVEEAIAEETKELLESRRYLLDQEQIRKTEEMAQRQAEAAAQEAEKKLRKEGATQSILSEILFNLVRMLPGIALSLVFSVFILYLLTEKRKKELFDLCKENPKEFILLLYENAKAVLRIFGMSFEAHLVPLAYARLVEKKYCIEDNLFLHLTIKFEEAKYSGHSLEINDALSVSENYNKFFKKVFSKYNKFFLFQRYCLGFIQRRPFFMPVLPA